MDEREQKATIGIINTGSRQLSVSVHANGESAALRIDANGELIFDYEYPCEYEVKVEKFLACVSGTPDKPIIFFLNRKFYLSWMSL